MPKAAIIDIDGTLTDCSHRLHFALQKDWDKFQSLSPLDTPVGPIIDLAWALRSAGWMVFLCTGRNEKYHRITKEWMDKHQVPYDAIFYRENGNVESDADYKRRKLYEMKSIYPKHSFLLAIDDRNSVVKMYREEGLLCLQPQEGSY